MPYRRTDDLFHIAFVVDVLEEVRRAGGTGDDDHLRDLRGDAIRVKGAGGDLEEAARHVEALEFLFECEYRRQILK